MGTSGENIKDLKNVGAGWGVSASDSLAEFTRVSSASDNSVNQSEAGGGLTGLESTELDPKKQNNTKTVKQITSFFRVKI